MGLSVLLSCRHERPGRAFSRKNCKSGAYMVRFQRHLLGLLVVGLGTVHAQNSTAPTTTDSVTDEDYAISAAAFTDVFWRRKAKGTGVD